MPFGPGKYERDARALFDATEASAVIIIVIGGARGDGFSVVCKATSPIASVAHQASLLRQLADTIERGEGGGQSVPGHRC